MNTDSIRYVPLFAGLAEQDVIQLTQALKPEKFAAGEVIFTSGAVSDALYIIDQGFVRLVAGDPASRQATALATLGQGSLLGEAEFLRASEHSVSAVAASEVVLLSLTDQSLRNLIHANPQIGIRLSQNFGDQIVQMEEYLGNRLASTEALGELPHNVLRTVAHYLRPLEIASGQALYNTGERPKGLFIVESGAIKLLPDANAPETDVRQAGPGHVLGIMSILTNKPYSRTAQVEEDSLVWFLPADDFHKISSHHPSLRRILGRRIRGRLGPADQTQAVIRLAQTPIFAKMPPQALHAIAQRLILQHVPAGEIIYRMGEAGDALYLVDEGEIELTAENASGVVEELARISGGGFFGEMSLLTGKNRSEDATATRNSNLWILYKSDLDELLGQFPSIGSALNAALQARLKAQQTSFDEARFRRFPLLAHLSTQDLQEVVRHMRPTRYRAGEQIFRAGTPGDSIFFIESGQVRMQPLAGQGWLLRSGDMLGEQSALTNQLRGQTAIAETDVDLFAIRRSDLDSLMMRLPTFAVSMSRFLSERMAMSPAAPVGAAPGQPVQSGAMTMSAQRRRAAASRPAPAPSQPRPSVGQWFAALSTGAKFRLALLLILLVYLFGVAAPMAVRALFSGADIAGADAPIAADALSGLQSSEIVATSGEAIAMAGIGLSESAVADNEAAPTPTYTPFPTDTPVPTATPTITPTPLPTNTPTPLPTNTPVPPPPPAPVQPVAEAQVQAASAPAEPPRAWDARLDQLGVNLAEAQVGSGQPYWRLIDAQWQNEQEAGGKHHIYVEVLDENGQRIVGQPVTVFWPDGGDTGVTEDKAPPDYAYNYPMYKAGNSYNVKIEGLPSDVVQGLGLGEPGEHRFYTIHTVFKLIFQRTIKP